MFQLLPSLLVITVTKYGRHGEKEEVLEDTRDDGFCLFLVLKRVAPNSAAAQVFQKGHRHSIYGSFSQKCAT